MAVVAAVGLAACTAEEEPGPRFANDPGPTADPASALSTPAPATVESLLPSASPLATPIDPAVLLRSRGAPSRLYFRSGAELWTLATDEAEAAPVFRPGPGESMIAAAVSPSGDRAAALVSAEASVAAAAVVVVDASGRELLRQDGLADGLPSGDEAVARDLDWSPQGDRLLISFEPGGIVAVPADGGDATTLVEPVDAPLPGDAAWSPTGEAIAFLAPSEAGRPADLFFASTVTSPAAPTPLVEAAAAQRSVRALAWMPDGRDVLYTLGGAPGAAVVSGDLWRIGTGGEDPRVVASAGSAVPVGRISRIAPATDGQAVAYTVTVPGEGGDRFHSLWVRSLEAASAIPVQLRVPPTEAVSQLWWTSSGLVFRTVPGSDPDAPSGDTDFGLYLAGADGEPTMLYRGGAEAAASPPASPVADAATPAP